MDLREAVLARLAQMGKPAPTGKEAAKPPLTTGKTTDPRGLAGQLSRGRNVYRAGSNAAHRGPGGPNMGRPETPVNMQEAAKRRLGS